MRFVVVHYLLIIRDEARRAIRRVSKPIPFAEKRGRADSGARVDSPRRSAGIIAEKRVRGNANLQSYNKALDNLQSNDKANVYLLGR